MNNHESNLNPIVTANPYIDEAFHLIPITPSHPPNLFDLKKKVQSNTSAKRNVDDQYSRSNKRQDVDGRDRSYDRSISNRNEPQTSIRHSIIPNQTATTRNDRTITIQQTVSFIRKNQDVDPQLWKDLKNIVIQKAKLQDYNQFSHKSLNDKILEIKNQFRTIDPSQLSKARLVSNPYEGIGSSCFMNRSAVKMANLDKLFGLLPKIQTTKFNFADICSGPGGFTEYIFWRCNKRRVPVHGYGLTLHGNQDFNLSNMVFQPPAGSFTPHYGKDKTGDIYHNENILDFSKAVLQGAPIGVDLVLADGGFSVLGDEQYQEEHSKQLLLTQILSMFTILKKGGNFVLKCFDILTPFTIECLYILYLFFEKIAIIKPITSRPANSERYIVCMNLTHPSPQDLIDYLMQVNSKLNDLKPDNRSNSSGHKRHQNGFISKQEKIDLELLDMTDFLSIDNIIKVDDFIDPIEGSNMKLAVKQKEALDDLLAYATQTQVEGWDQVGIASQCCKEWDIPFIQK
ncbi:FtsJ-like methyltransferase-domain-containing protein [Globomyces pollinis-pini]|nr:FtsJ-like methyltransferase-domain-containing protein [Globomyces pollinis-pini]